MTQLPQVTGERLVRALLKLGFVEARRTGGHAIVRHASDPTRRASIPMHGSKAVRPGTLRAILKGAGVTIDELNRAL